MSQTGQHLRQKAQDLSGALPPLLAKAERLAATVAMGVHGRKRAGMGESFWQYRHAMPGDNAGNIDWRRSAQGDALFVREREWEAAQTVAFWCDCSASMAYSSKKSLDAKALRAQVLTLSLASLLARAGERIAMLDSRAEKPGVGELKVQQIADVMAQDQSGDDVAKIPPPGGFTVGHSIFMSDFMAPDADIFPALERHAKNGGAGCIVHILDPSEEDFPFDGRTIFESMAGIVDFETLKAKALRGAYKDRLEQRSRQLQQWAARNGWHYLRHRTDQNPRSALLWLFGVVGDQL